MDVHVDEPGTDEEPGRDVHAERAVERQAGSDRRDAASLDADIDHPVDSLPGVDDPSTLEHHRLHRHAAPSWVSNPASR